MKLKLKLKLHPSRNEGRIEKGCKYRGGMCKATTTKEGYDNDGLFCSFLACIACRKEGKIG